MYYTPLYRNTEIGLCLYVHTSIVFFQWLERHIVDEEVLGSNLTNLTMTFKRDSVHDTRMLKKLSTNTDKNICSPITADSPINILNSPIYCRKQNTKYEY